MYFFRSYTGAFLFFFVVSVQYFGVSNRLFDHFVLISFRELQWNSHCLIYEISISLNSTLVIAQSYISYGKV